jgi:hypothetical protein
MYIRTDSKKNTLNNSTTEETMRLKLILWEMEYVTNGRE